MYTVDTPIIFTHIILNRSLILFLEYHLLSKFPKLFQHKLIPIVQVLEPLTQTLLALRLNNNKMHSVRFVLLYLAG